MANSDRYTSRYQREQRIMVATWAVFAVIGAMLAWAYLHWSSTRSDISGDATPPIATTPSIHGWLDRSERLINDVIAARNAIAAAAAHHDIAGTGAACQTATGAIAHLHQEMPSPEPVLNSTLQQAISDYSTGLHYCISAGRTEDGEGLPQAATYISQGDDAMRVVLDILSNESEVQPGNLGVLIV
jgi:predicted metal-binding membrane protein